MDEENKAIIRRFIEAFEKNDQETIRELVAGDYTAHGPGAPKPVDRETLMQQISVFNAAFRDLHVVIEQQIAEGDLVTSRLTWRGTHTGEFQGIAPTGKQVAVSAVSIERVKDGKIAERWFLQDYLGLMRQLGAIPSPPPGD